MRTSEIVGPIERFAIFSCATVIVVAGGCGGMPAPRLPNESTAPIDHDRFELLVRLVHISDAQIMDEQSPGRLTIFAALSRSAWRPHEAYSVQLLDGMIRTINKMHVAQHPIDFVIHTGDAVDNVQRNELDWFISTFDGGTINPLTGPDDRDPSEIPQRLLDPHAPFDAQGLYRRGVHGISDTILWYSVPGNHDRFASGTFPIVSNAEAIRVAPMPLDLRLGLDIPLQLDPTASVAWAPISPANPGPPSNASLPTSVVPNPNRRFFTAREFVQAHLDSTSEPPGHGFDASTPDQTWYSVSPRPGLRLITLNSATPLLETPQRIRTEGAISAAQLVFLRRELDAADDAGECVIVATHHPSGAIEPVYGSALTPRSFRRLLNQHKSVALHLAGHWHYNDVIDRGGYVEIVTSSIIDLPQQGRVIEIWRKNREPASPDSAPTDATGSIELRYRLFSHLDEITPPPGDEHIALFDDPLMPLRRMAAQLAGVTD